MCVLIRVPKYIHICIYMGLPFCIFTRTSGSDYHRTTLIYLSLCFRVYVFAITHLVVRWHRYTHTRIHIIYIYIYLLAHGSIYLHADLDVCVYICDWSSSMGIFSCVNSTSSKNTTSVQFSGIRFHSISLATPFENQSTDPTSRYPNFPVRTTRPPRFYSNPPLLLPACFSWLL